MCWQEVVMFFTGRWKVVLIEVAPRDILSCESMFVRAVISSLVGLDWADCEQKAR